MSHSVVFLILRRPTHYSSITQILISAVYFLVKSRNSQLPQQEHVLTLPPFTFGLPFLEKQAKFILIIIKYSLLVTHTHQVSN